MKRHNLLLNMVVTIIAASFCAVSVLAAEGDLSSPLPSKEKTSEKEGKDVKLELTSPVPVSPTVESGEVEEAVSPETLDEEDLEGVESENAEISEEEITAQEPQETRQPEQEQKTKPASGKKQ